MLAIFWNIITIVAAILIIMGSASFIITEFFSYCAEADEMDSELGSLRGYHRGKKE